MGLILQNAAAASFLWYKEYLLYTDLNHVYFPIFSNLCICGLWNMYEIFNVKNKKRNFNEM